MTDQETAGEQVERVGWMFVQEYYTCLNKTPSSLHRFYLADSTFVHGFEGEQAEPHTGQQEIHRKITDSNFVDCKVLVSNLDAQPSFSGGIMLQVLGEMSNDGKETFKFAQTFFLAKQTKGYYVLNDMFRYLKDEVNTAYEHTEDIVANGHIDKIVSPPQSQESPMLIAEKVQEMVPVQEKAPERPQEKAPERPQEKTVEKALEKTQEKVQVSVNGVQETEEPKPATRQSNGQVRKGSDRNQQRPASPLKQTPTIQQKESPVKEAQREVPVKEAQREAQSESPLVSTESKPEQVDVPVKKTWAKLATANADKPVTLSVAQSNNVSRAVKPITQQKFDPHRKSDHPLNEREKYSVFVGDLAPDTTSTAIFEAFCDKGNIVSIEIIAAKKVAFVEFASIEICMNAVGSHAIVNGKRLVMDPRTGRRPKNSKASEKRDSKEKKDQVKK